MNEHTIHPLPIIEDTEFLEFTIQREAILGHELFPMPIAPLEKYMLWDDTRDHPKRFRVAMLFQGSLDKKAAETAFKWVLPRHAMLLAKPNHPTQPSTWILPETQTFRIPWSPTGFEYLPIDAFAHGTHADFAGLQFWFYQQGPWIEWCLDFHHANTDGRGGRLFVLDLLRAYEEACHGHLSYQKSVRLNPEALLHRAVFRRAQPKPTSENKVPSSSEVPPSTDESSQGPRSTTWVEKLVHGFHFHVLGPKPLASSRVDATAPKKGPSPRLLYQKTSLTADCTRQLEQEMLPQALSWNELGLALLFRTLGIWNEEHGLAKGRLRVMVPIDLRDYGDRYMPAANRFGFAFVVVKQEQCQDHAFVLQSVRKQMKRIQGLQLAIDFNGIFEACQGNRVGQWLLRRALPRLGCFATAIMTTLGDLTKHTRKSHRFDDDVPLVADMKLDSVVGVPPLRNQTSFSVGLTNAAGALHLASIVDQVALGTQSTQLHHAFCESWQSWLKGEISMEGKS